MLQKEQLIATEQLVKLIQIQSTFPMRAAGRDSFATQYFEDNFSFGNFLTSVIANIEFVKCLLFVGDTQTLP